MNEKTYKSRCVEGFTPNEQYRKGWDQAFAKKEINCPDCQAKQEQQKQVRTLTGYRYECQVCLVQWKDVKGRGIVTWSTRKKKTNDAR